MILTLATTHTPATDLGYLLHKNPQNVFEKNLNFGKATVFYSEASAERCEAVLHMALDPVKLVREGRYQFQYTSDRPYVASSFLTTALREVFSTALSGRSKDRPDLVEIALPVSARLPVVHCRGGEEVIRMLFEPLGYHVELTRLPSDEQFPEWGLSHYFDLKIEGNQTIRDLLTHLYVLIPVLDGDKHYFVDSDEMEKLIRKGEGWLSSHPHKEIIVNRYLHRKTRLTREAMARLTEEVEDVDETADAQDAEELKLEKKISLHVMRLQRVAETVDKLGARTVADLGCGEGRLIRELIKNKRITQITGMDVSFASLRKAMREHERMPERQASRLKLIHGSLMYVDRRLDGHDVATLVEVIEHLDAPRLTALEKTLFGATQPPHVIVTTPNSEYNALFEGMVPGQMRHKDHRFEWTRAEFQAWCESVAASYGYTFRIEPLGDEVEGHGAPSQMAVFSK